MGIQRRRFFLWLFIGLLKCLFITPDCSAQGLQTITKEALRDKIEAYWYGQLVGNYMGFPFENVYREEPVPILIERYFTVEDLKDFDLEMNKDDRRSYGHIMADAMGGAWSDDDTDIEFVTLHAVEKYGLDITYSEITEMWKAHINRFIWAANRKARDLMETGLVPPATGSKLNNPYWYRITSQLVNEIWSVFYPGMIDQAAERAEWGAKIMCDDWAVHATRAYAVMYSAAFFENDVKKLVSMAAESLPDKSPYKRGMIDVMHWYSINDDWRATRKLIHENYYEFVDDFKVPDPYVAAVVNGLSGIMAILYGQGDFRKTVGIAVSAGYDCDNQAATCGGLLGIINGTKGIPEDLLLKLPSRYDWKVPFNNTYINYSRDNLPNYNRISDIVNRILTISEQAILDNGGSIKTDRDTVYQITNDYSSNSSKDDVEGLITLLADLEAKEQISLLRQHFRSVRTMVEDKTHDIAWTAQDSSWASNALTFFRNEGAHWKTYTEGPRPLIMSFTSPSDGKNSFYWLFLPRAFDSTVHDYPFYMELHGSGGGKNDNPRNMLFRPLQPEIKGVTSQGYRKEGLFIYPWGRGDKWYRDQSEKDIFECLAHFDNLFTTDATRQYIYGFSMGGGGAFHFAQKTRERWSAVGIYSGALGEFTRDQAALLKNMPVWIMWGEKERLAASNKKLKDYLLNVGADVRWKEIENIEHKYLAEYQTDLMDWFLTKHK
ncbi:MAG: hypothetical protein HKN76_17895 [Saprospiraceae bacterium]|nr:hypothetical protein [Saprospiraceae bacterium]